MRRGRTGGGTDVRTALSPLAFRHRCDQTPPFQPEPGGHPPGATTAFTRLLEPATAVLTRHALRPPRAASPCQARPGSRRSSRRSCSARVFLIHRAPSSTAHGSHQAPGLQVNRKSPPPPLGSAIEAKDKTRPAADQGQKRTAAAGGNNRGWLVVATHIGHLDDHHARDPQARSAPPLVGPAASAMPVPMGARSSAEAVSALARRA